MMKKTCIAALGAYLLSKKTNLLPQGGLVHAVAKPPTFENIRDSPFETNLYRQPAINLREYGRIVMYEFGDEDYQETWYNGDQDVATWNRNWDGMEQIQPRSFSKARTTRQLHLFAMEENENGERTGRGVDQENANNNIVTGMRSETLRKMGIPETPDHSYKDLTGFPVSRMDPPHSDVTVPRGHDARADFWKMEHAFRKICHRHIYEEGNFLTPSYKLEYYLSLPKNLIAYIVQRLMQFPPETFGRFRISDGSHTHVYITYNGMPQVIVIGGTSHLQKEYMARNHDFDRGSGDIGLDAPDAEDEDLGGGDSAQNGPGPYGDLDDDPAYCELEEGSWDVYDEDASDDENCGNGGGDGVRSNRQFRLF